MARRKISLSLLAMAAIALPAGGVALVTADVAVAKKHHKKHHHKKKKKKAICGGLADGSTTPGENAAVQFGCTKGTFSSFTVTINHTVVAKTEGSRAYPFVAFNGGTSGCTITGSQSFSCTVPAQPVGNEVKAFFVEQESCTGLQVTVTVNGKASKIPVAAACK